MALHRFISNLSARVKDLADQVGSVTTLDFYSALEQLEEVEKRLLSLTAELEEIGSQINHLDDGPGVTVLDRSDEVIN